MESTLHPALADFKDFGTDDFWFATPSTNVNVTADTGAAIGRG
jgi:hypothetical protein